MGLINTVLDLSKIEAGQFSLNMSEYALDSMVENVRVATESLAQGKKLALKTDVPKGLPHGVGDEQRLTQVLLNLVGNAIKFTDVGEVRIAAGIKGGRFAVAVTDTGPGIPAEEQHKIFEEFHQVDNSNTKKQGRNGPRACHRQADRRDAWRPHLGGIEPRQGLHLPHGASRPRRSRQRCRMSKRILVVEDQEDLRAILRDFLTASGYDVVEAVDGGEASPGAVRAPRPYPHGHPASRARWLRGHPADQGRPDLKATPVIAVSSFAMKGDEEKARASGCDGYVTKPYSPVKLLGVIRGLFWPTSNSRKPTQSPHQPAPAATAAP